MSDDGLPISGSSARLFRFVPDSYTWLFGISTQQLSLVVGILAVAVQCLFFVRVPPATGYETSVVTAYPLPFWICFGVGIGTAVLVFLGSAVTASKYWQHGFVLLACNYGLFFTLPLARGYTMYARGTDDTLYHLAMVKETVATGSLPDVLLYPLVHLLLSELTLVGQSIEALRYLLPFLFMMLFVGSVGLLLQELTDDRRALPAGLCAATPLIFGDLHFQIHPATMSFILLPITIAVIERIRQTESKRHVVLAVTFVLAIVFFHPITTLFLIALVVSTVLFGHAYNWIAQHDDRKLRPLLAVIALCVGVTWYINFGRTQHAIIKVVVGEKSAAATQVNKASEAALSTIDLLRRFVQLYGAVFIYLSIAGLFSLVILYRISQHRHRYSETYGLYQFSIGFLIAVTFLLTFLSSKNPIRVSRYMILMAVVLIALLLYRVTVRTGRYRRLVTVLLGSSIVVAAILGAFATYQPNKHMTQAEYEGAEFMAEYPNDALPVRSYDLTRKTYLYVTRGTDIDPYPPAYRDTDPAYWLFPRLGYDNNSTAIQSYGRSYLVTQEYDTEQHTATYFTEAQQREHFFYGEADVARLHRDPTAHEIYSNGGFRGWYVTSRRAN